MRIELDFGKFVKSYTVVGQKDNKYLIIERSPAVLDAISRNPNPMVKVITEDSVQTGLGVISYNVSPMEVTAVVSSEKQEKTGKTKASSKNEQ